MALRALAFLAVPAVGLAELAGHFYFSSRPPRPDEWRAIRSVVEKTRRGGELVVVAPEWAEPNARYALGDALMPLADVARADESARPRAIEVSILGAAAPELATWKLVSEQRSGKFRIRVLDNPVPAHVTYDFLDHVADAEVFDLSSPAPLPCPWITNAQKLAGGLHGDPAFPALRHQCAGSSEHFVGVTVIEDQSWRGRRCVWALPGSSPLSIQYRNVPLGAVVRGYAATPWWTERELHGAPIRMTVRVADEQIGEYVHRDGDGWKGFTFPVGARAGTSADVEFRVDGARGRERQFCFQADSR